MRLLQAIDEIGPDMILIAGDMLTAKPKAKLEMAVGFLAELARKYPVYYGNGNHEHRLKLSLKIRGIWRDGMKRLFRRSVFTGLSTSIRIFRNTGSASMVLKIDRLY